MTPKSTTPPPVNPLEGEAIVTLHIREAISEATERCENIGGLRRVADRLAAVECEQRKQEGVTMELSGKFIALDTEFKTTKRITLYVAPLIFALASAAIVGVIWHEFQKFHDIINKGFKTAETAQVQRADKATAMAEESQFTIVPYASASTKK